MQTQITIKGSNNYELLNLKRVGKTTKMLYGLIKILQPGKKIILYFL